MSPVLSFFSFLSGSNRFGDEANPLCLRRVRRRHAHPQLHVPALLQSLGRGVPVFHAEQLAQQPLVRLSYRVILRRLGELTAAVWCATVAAGPNNQSAKHRPLSTGLACLALSSP